MAINDNQWQSTALIDSHTPQLLTLTCGLPGFTSDGEGAAHALHAWRAVQIALRCRAALLPAGLDCAAGVTTGRMFCGEGGSYRSRAEYTLHGRLVNL